MPNLDKKAYTHQNYNQTKQNLPEIDKINQLPTKIETNIADVHDIMNTSMTDIHQSALGANTSTHTKQKTANSATNKISIDYNHGCDLARIEKFKTMLQ